MLPLAIDYPVPDSRLKAGDRMVGILVAGDNHFIVHGPLPDRTTALALVRHWSLIQIGGSMPVELAGWRIVSREFRENLEWAVLVPGNGEMSPAVATLLGELSARGITIHSVHVGQSLHPDGGSLTEPPHE
jgi:hypothetical protein